MYCPKCNEFVPESSRSCANCGCKINSSQSSAGKKVSVAAHPEYKELGGILLFTVVCSIIGIIGMIALCLKWIYLINSYEADFDDSIKIVGYLYILMTGLITVFEIKYVKDVINREVTFLKTFEITMILTLVSVIIARVIGLFDQTKTITSIISVLGAYFIWGLYYTSSVRVRTYFETSAYTDESILWKWATPPDPSAPDFVPETTNKKSDMDKLIRVTEDAWKCTCGNINPKTMTICRCGEKRFAALAKQRAEAVKKENN